MPRDEEQPAKKTEEKEHSFNLRHTLLAFADLPRVLRLVWGASPSLVTAMALLMLLMGLTPLAQAIVARLLIDGAIEGINRGSIAPIVFPIILEFALSLLNRTCMRFHSTSQILLNQRFSNHITLMILHKTNILDLSFFENAEFYDRLNRARKDVANKPLMMIMQLFGMGTSLLTMLGMMMLLFQLSWWLALLSLLVPIPLFLANSRYGLRNYWMEFWQSPRKRQQLYLYSLLTTDDFNKEIKLFNLSTHFTNRYHVLSEEMYQEDRKLQVKHTWVSLLWSMLPELANAGIYLYVAFQVIGRRISLGEMTQYTLAIYQVSQNFQTLLEGISEMYENHLFINTLFDFLAYEPKIVAPTDPQPLEKSPDANGLTLQCRNVSFTYPGKDEPTLKQVSFTLHEGESIALVGLNGAGKTTLVKLFTRLYDPDEGEILINGRNIKEYDPSELREQIGVIFQDYVKYNMTAIDNIGIGRVTQIKNRDLVEKAAQKSGAHDVLTHLDQGYDTMLGHWFDEGVNLSGGEWQKIALARAFMRDAPLLILDEPTSSLDAQAEYDIFQRFRHLTAGRTVIFISHRFSTVRLADRIFVLEGGTLLESGSHQELLALKGRYADLFHLQAEAYR